MLEPRNQQTLPRVLRKRAERQANKAWIVTDQGSFTYGEMDRQSDRLARGLARARDSLEGTRAFFEKREPKFTGE